MPSSDYCRHGKFWRCEQCDIEDAAMEAASAARKRAREEAKKEQQAEVQNFICYLINNCEREIITEEFLQREYAEYLKAK